MKVPLSWLKEYIDLTLSPAQISKMLTLAGLEVDSTETSSLGFEKVVVGRIIDVKKHPEADQLTLATVTDGIDSYQVVCGAPNCRAGIKTAFAQIGATLIDDEGKPFKVKKSKLRGIDSFGMLCSAKELHISQEYEGIIEFAEHLKEGADVADMYADTIFDVSLTPNLGHCASILGVARELSAATGQPIRIPDVGVVEDFNDPISSHVSVEVVDPHSCPRYVCRLVKNVKVGPSPEWLQRRLAACGLRPINNIVDITNYVLMEFGHPLHAFDFDKLEEKGIVVRQAIEGEHFVTLDGKEWVLNKEDLLICDKARPVALAGIMGGSNSEVSDATVNVLIEAAYFLPTVIRRTSKRLGIQTDASKRFERGTDPNALSQAAAYAAQLMQVIAQGTVCEGVLDVAAQDFPEKSVTCRLSRANQILGTHLSVSEVESIFQRLQLPSAWDGQDIFALKIPTYRHDLNEEIDLIEEIARLYGYDNMTQPACRFQSSLLEDAPIFLFEREIRAGLLAEGLQEFLTCDLIGPSLLKIVQGEEMLPDSMVKVLNPTSIEQSIMRTSLLPGLLQVIKYNWDHQNANSSGFEVGRIHFKEGENYKEQSMAGIVLSGKNAPHYWDQPSRDYDFFDLKGMIENAIERLKVGEEVIFKENHLNSFHPGRQAAIYIGSLEVGSMGEVHPSIVRRLDVPQRIFFAELNLHDLFQVRKAGQKMQELPIYPGSERDWTVTLDEAMPIADVIKYIRATPSRLLEDISLLYVYQSEKLGKGLKNATFHFTYRDRRKTIEQERVDREHSRIVDEVSNLIKK
jgi:phenylalanyl-tRNA synthetase beta chain